MQNLGCAKKFLCLTVSTTCGYLYLIPPGDENKILLGTLGDVLPRCGSRRRRNAFMLLDEGDFLWPQLVN
jgi:hypothetical protein